MDGGPHPALFLMQRYILGPCCIAFLFFGSWALVEEHWGSSVLLLTASVLGAAIGYGLTAGRSEEPVSEQAPSADAGEETEPDDSQALASAIVKANILFSCLLMGLVWSEGLPLIRSAVFVVLFSILFPAAAALFCIMGEQMMRQHARENRWVHRGPPQHPGARPAH